MHDPMIVAFRICYPWQIFGKRRKYDDFITIWHVDPEKDGTDNSCGWFSPKLTKKEREEADGFIEACLEHRELTNDERYDFDRTVYFAIRDYKRTKRPRWRHPRWHIWHWKIQIHFIQSLKRKLFSRCEVCGKRFGWGYSPLSGSWYGTGPRWFRKERGVRHFDCERVEAPEEMEAV